MIKDWVSHTFSVIEEHGEDISIIYGRPDPDSGDVSWFTLSHDKYDGVGGFNKVLSELEITSSRSPTFTGKKPSWIRYVRGFLFSLKDAGVRRQEWHSFDRSKPNIEGEPEKRLAYYIFSLQETQAILAHAKVEDVTANSYLLRYLDHAVREALIPNDCNTAWVVPVNLRGAITRYSEFVPNMSFWAVSCNAQDTSESIHKRINRLKRNHYHYGTWMLFNAGKLLGESAIHRDLKAKEAGNHSWTGTFSNLGNWTLSEDDPWLFAPNIARTNPVAAGCITVNGRMALTIQLHAALGQPLKAAQKIIRSWKKNCLKISMGRNEVVSI